MNPSGGNQNFWGLGTPNGASLAWIGSFEPNWNESDFYPAIIVDSYNDIIVNTVDSPRVMLFPTFELAKEFKECFKDLLEEAKMLL